MKVIRWFNIIALTIALTISPGYVSFGAEESVIPDTAVSVEAETLSGEGEVLQPEESADLLEDREYAEDQLLVIYEDGISNKKIRQSAAESDAEVLDITSTIDEEKTAVVSIAEEDSMEEAIEKFRQDDRVAYVQPNYRYTLDGADPYLSEEYFLYSASAVAGGIGILTAWEIVESGSHGQTLVGVVDSGVQASHVDLQQNRVGSSSGKYMVTDNGVFWESETDCAASGHGTHVTGILAADYGNGKGGTGVASGTSNDLVRAFVVGACADGKNLFTYDLVNAILYAKEQGARVINMSLGGAGRDRVLEKIIRACDDEGILFVAASGNAGSDKVMSPADIKEVIAVNWSTMDGMRAVKSNYGICKDVSAPGDSILNTIPGNRYGYMSGTSMATPMVSGIAALMLDVNGSLTPAQVRNIIEATASGGGSFDRDMAYGIVNAEEAVRVARDASTQTAVQSVTMKEQSVTIYAGDDHSLESLILPATSLAAVSWESSNRSVATVDEDGYVKGISSGEADITCRAGGKSAVCHVTVISSTAAKSLTITGIPVGNFLLLDEEYDLNTIVAPYGALNAGEIYWESSDTSVLRALEGGCVIPVSLGTARVTAYNFDRTVSDTVTLKVVNPPTGIRVTYKASYARLGTSPQFKASATGTAPLNTYLYWYSSDESVAAINSSGVLTPRRTGTTEITVENTVGQDYSWKVTVVKNNYSGADYNLKKKAAARKTITIQWKKIPSATGYEIYRATSKNGKYKKVKTITNGKTTSYKDKKLKKKKNYYYRIRAIYKENGKQKTFGYSKKVKIKTKK